MLVPAAIAWSAGPATGAPPSNDPQTAAKIAATWVAHQVNDQGFIPQAGNPSTPNFSNSVQAVLTLASAGVGRPQVDALVAYLGDHVDEFVIRSGNDDAGALAYLILDAAAAGTDPTDFGSGHEDLVARLEATQQPDGLFGASAAAFDGAFRQGLALLALHAAGHSNSDGADWLEDQQCDDGLWTSFRLDTSVACPDPPSFDPPSPDTNSTALAVLGLKSQGRTAPATDGANALIAVRNADGAWGFLATSDQPTDANSTGVVVSALRATTGVHDAQGVSALLALQLGCDADAADIGGIAFQSSPDGLVPDLFATNGAAPALANVVLPVESAAISPDLVDPCPVAATTTTTTTTPVTTTLVTVRANTLGNLAQGGTAATTEVGWGLMLVGAGCVLVQLAQDRRRRYS